MPSPENLQPYYSEISQRLDGILRDVEPTIETKADGTLSSTWLGNDLRLLIPELPALMEYRVSLEAQYSETATFWGGVFNKMNRRPTLSADFRREISRHKLVDDQGTAIHELHVAKRTYGGSVKTGNHTFAIPPGSTVYDISVATWYDYHGQTALFLRLVANTGELQIPVPDDPFNRKHSANPDERQLYLARITHTLEQFTS